MIKLFEQYNEYYTEIDDVNFSDCVIFTDSEIKHIENYMKDLFGTDSYVLKCSLLTDKPINGRIYSLKVGYRRPVSSGAFVFRSNDLNTKIYSLGDEWYVVNLTNNSFSDELYKCDQLEGLFELLTNKL